ncbi:MAG: hypothetical protein ACLGH8_06825 [Bacteroidia bacterium]
MSEKREILIQINTNAQKAAEELKKSTETVKQLKDTLSELKDSNQKNTEEYKKLSEALKLQQANVKQYKKTLNELESENKKSITTNQDLNKTLAKGSSTYNDYQSQNEKLLAIRGRLNSSDANYVANLARINGQIKQNNDKLAEADEIFKNGGLTMDYYKNKVTESFNAVNVFNGGLGGLATRIQEAGGVGKLFGTSIKGMKDGIMGMGAAIKANPIGALLSILGPIIEKLLNFAPLTNAVEKAFAALSPVLEIVNKPIEILAKGIEWVAGGIANLMNVMFDSAKAASDLAKEQDNLNKQMALQERNNERAKKQADELIERSKDQTLSVQERANALQGARAVEDENLKKQMELANLSVRIEEEKLKQKKELTDSEIELLKNGTEEDKLALIELKKITGEEIQGLEKAYLDKMRLAENETKAKEKQAADVKALTDSIIQQAKNENLSDAERKKMIDEAIAKEKQYYDGRKKQMADDYKAQVEKMIENSNLSEADKKLILNNTEVYKNASILKGILTQGQIAQLQNLNDASADYARQEAARMANLATSTKVSADVVIKKHRDQLDIWELQNRDGKKTLTDRVNFENEYAKRSQALLSEQYKNQKITQEEFKKESIRLEQERTTNIKQLRKDEADKAIEYQNAVLNHYLQTEGNKAKNLEEEIAFAKETARQKMEIAQNAFNASDKTETDRLKLQTEQTAINLEQQKATAEAAIANFEAQLALENQFYEAKKINQSKVTAESLTAESEHLLRVRNTKLQELNYGKEFDAEELKQKYESGAALTLAEQQYLANVQALENEYTTANKAVKEQENALQIQQVKEKYDTDRANAATQFEQDRINEAERHEVVMTELNQQLADKKISLDEFKAKEAEEDKTHSENKKKLDAAVFDNKLNLASQTFGNLQTLLGKESAAGKAMAVAQATIDTYKSAVSAYSAMTGIPVVGPALGAIAAAAAVAAGIQNIKKITSTKAPKAERGALFSIGGKRHSQGGTMFTGEDGTRFEAESGEIIGVMNRNAAHHFMAFNNAFPAGAGSAANYFASGGIVSREVSAKGLDIEELANRIAQANAAIPAPVVAVQDIITQTGSQVRVRQGANF